jgi:tRNA(fMet)-specific endonuclease VapC
MKLYVLDTDIAGFVQSEHPGVTQRMHLLAADHAVVTTIITFGEDLGGWLLACRRARDGPARVKAYARMRRGLDFYQQIACLPFDEAAATIFDGLRGVKIRIGANDLSIAAITLSNGGILVTRNTADFDRVPNLVTEDWTK